MVRHDAAAGRHQDGCRLAVLVDHAVSLGGIRTAGKADRDAAVAGEAEDDPRSGGRRRSVSCRTRRSTGRGSAAVRSDAKVPEPPRAARRAPRRRGPVPAWMRVCSQQAVRDRRRRGAIVVLLSGSDSCGVAPERRPGGKQGRSPPQLRRRTRLWPAIEGDKADSKPESPSRPRSSRSRKLRR